MPSELTVSKRDLLTNYQEKGLLKDSAMTKRDSGAESTRVFVASVARKGWLGDRNAFKPTPRSRSTIYAIMLIVAAVCHGTAVQAGQWAVHVGCKTYK